MEIMIGYVTEDFDGIKLKSDNGYKEFYNTWNLSLVRDELTKLVNDYSKYKKLDISELKVNALIKYLNHEINEIRGV